MHFNLAALFRHYVSDHAAYSFTNICLYDGLLFDSFKALESHVAMHESNKHARIVNTIKNEEFYTKAKSRKFSCDNCDQSFDSNYSLIVSNFNVLF